MSQKKIFFLIGFLVFSISSLAQQPNFPLNHQYSLIYDKIFLKRPHHTSFRPLINSSTSINIDSISHSSFKLDYGNYYMNKIFAEHFIEVQNKEFHFFVSPILNLALGRENEDKKNTFINTRGILIGGKIGEKIKFESKFLENQAVFPNYIDDYIKTYNIAPGEGYVRPFNNNGYDYSMSSGYISFEPFNRLKIQFGHGKHFIGDGYRSLILSDLSFNYPFLRIQTNFNKIQYTNLFAQFQDIRNPLSYANGFTRKYMASHHLSININNKLNIGLYEAVIFSNDISAGNNSFDINYLNPVIFFRPVEYSLNSPNNVLIGLNVKYIILAQAYLYGQVILDEFSLSEMREVDNWWGEKYGYQIGLKTYDFFSIKNFILQSEYNFVRPYTYAHSDPLQSYSHYNQPLAHPLGANFSESLIILYYRWKRLTARTQLVYAKYGGKKLNDPTSYGNDLFLSTNNRNLDSGVEMYQGNLHKLNYFNASLGYIINPITNLKLNIGFSKRKLSNKNSTELTNYYYFSFSTELFNRYYDF
ncbi:MAG: hypothetical protein VX370_02825 [Bacteroidota bacterium]|nr:hypothetical protein [Bacteroidota bacterium]